MRFELPFARTECDCKACSVFCKGMPGYLIPSDLDILCPSLTLREEWAKHNLLASEGAKVIKLGKVLQIPTLVPRTNPDGSCINLLEDGKCAIHETSPFGCAYFDTHQREGEYVRRSSHGLEMIWRDLGNGGPYYRLWVFLDELGFRAEPVSVRRARVGS